MIHLVTHDLNVFEVDRKLMEQIVLFYIKQTALLVKV